MCVTEQEKENASDVVVWGALKNLHWNEKYFSSSLQYFKANYLLILINYVIYSQWISHLYDICNIPLVARQANGSTTETSSETKHKNKNKPYYNARLMGVKERSAKLKTRHTYTAQQMWTMERDRMGERVCVCTKKRITKEKMKNTLDSAKSKNWKNNHRRNTK